MLKTTLVIVGSIVVLGLFISGLRLFLLKRSVAQYDRYWADLAEKTPDENDFVYIAMGDSAAQGIGASKPQNGYVGLIADYISNKTGKNVAIYNISESGEKIRGAIDSQIPLLDELPRPDILTIDIGANNVTTFDSSSFEKEFTELLDRLPSNAIVANVPSFANGILFRKTNDSIKANNIATELVGESDSHYLANVFESTKNLGFFDFAADYFHPNDKAYQKWASAFIDSIESNLDLDK